jgi:hypothetical protein
MLKFFRRSFMCGGSGINHVEKRVRLPQDYDNLRSSLNGLAAQWNSQVAPSLSNQGFETNITSSNGDIINRSALRQVQTDLIYNELYREASVLDDILDADQHLDSSTETVNSLRYAESAPHVSESDSRRAFNDILAASENILDVEYGDPDGIEPEDILMNDFQPQNAIGPRNGIDDL